jgi:hypothetical protein
MSDWLSQLTDAYAVDAIRPLSVSSETVGWSERLTRRDGAPESLPWRMTLEVHAVVRNGSIDYLSGPYPPFPLRRSGTSSQPDATSSPVGAPPIAMFLGSALSLATLAALVTKGGPPLWAALGRLSDHTG